MFQVITSKPEQLKTLLAQILFRPAVETDGAMFPADLSVSEIQTFLQIDDDVLTAWLEANGLRDPADNEVPELLGDLWEVCNKPTLQRYAIDEMLTPLLTHFQPGLLTWEIEDDYDAEKGGKASRLFHYTPLEELDFKNHMDWYANLQQSYLASNEETV